jgi:hypothetical protein
VQQAKTFLLHASSVNAIKKILVLGGYGVFGSLFSRLLVTEDNCKVIIAERNATAAQHCIQRLEQGVTTSQVTAAIFDVNSQSPQQVSLLKPDVVVHTCGPLRMGNSILERYRNQRTRSNSRLAFAKSDAWGGVVGRMWFTEAAQDRRYAVANTRFSCVGPSSARARLTVFYRVVMSAFGQSGHLTSYALLTEI